MDSKNLINQKFGKLTVIEEIDEQSNNGKKQYRCHCECGNDCVVCADDILSGASKSCGCDDTYSEHGIEQKSSNKDEIKKFKEHADAFNKGLYSDIASFKNGLILILAIISIVMLFIVLK